MCNGGEIYIIEESCDSIENVPTYLGARSFELDRGWLQDNEAAEIEQVF